MDSYKLIGIILARVDSARLPGKALRLVNGVPLIGYVIERAMRITNLKSLVLATTERLVDDKLVDYAIKKGIDVCRGSFQDVALRILKCAKDLEADYFIRLNGDSPFLDPDLISSATEYCLNRQFDLITNLASRTFPYGISVEIIKCSTYEKVYQSMNDEEREHVTQYFYRHKENFIIKDISSPYPELSNIRMVVDVKEDIDIMERVIAHLGDSVFDSNYKQTAEIFLQQRGDV